MAYLLTSRSLPAELAAFPAPLSGERVFCYGRHAVRRLVLGDRRYHERLFHAGRRSWATAAYPPGCRPRRGPVAFTSGPDGSLLVHVERRDLAVDDGRLRMLFATGVGVFASPRDLTAFAHGPLAQAFGLAAPADDADDVVGGADAPARPVCLDAAPAAAAPEAILSPEQVATQLSRIVYGQDAALERVAHAAAVQLAKGAPRRPGVVMLLGPTGTGKTTTIEALPAVLRSLGRPGAHVFRVDCNELTQSFQVSRLIGAPPGYVGHETLPPLLQALATPGCILLLDEIDKAHPSIIEAALLNLLDTGRLSAPDGTTVDAAHALIAMTTSLGADELDSRLHRIELDNRWAVQHACRAHLEDEGLPAELIGRVGAFAAYRPLGEEALGRAAILAVKRLAQEYRLRVPDVDPILADVVIDIAGGGGLGARGLDHAAAAFLGGAFAAAVREGTRGTVTVDPGPPPTVRADDTPPARRAPTVQAS
jgi:hypothetical protein